MPEEIDQICQLKSTDFWRVEPNTVKFLNSPLAQNQQDINIGLATDHTSNQIIFIFDFNSHLNRIPFLPEDELYQSRI